MPSVTNAYARTEDGPGHRSDLIAAFGRPSLTLRSSDASCAPPTWCGGNAAVCSTTTFFLSPAQPGIEEHLRDLGVFCRSRWVHEHEAVAHGENGLRWEPWICQMGRAEFMMKSSKHQAPTSIDIQSSQNTGLELDAELSGGWSLVCLEFCTAATLPNAIYMQSTNAAP